MDWIVAGVIEQAGRWMAALIVIGVAIGGALFVGLPWLIEHVSITVR